MELLKPHLNEIQIPTAHSKVYKDECVFSFDNPVSRFFGYVFLARNSSVFSQESQDGIYVSLSTFIGLGREHVERYYKKTNRALYLHIRREKHEVVQRHSHPVLFNTFSHLGASGTGRRTRKEDHTIGDWS